MLTWRRWATHRRPRQVQAVPAMAGAATERDQRLAAVFQKTFREHYGWGMVFCTFHRMFTFLSITLHLLVARVYRARRPALFASAAVTAAFCELVREIHAFFIHGNEMLWSRRMSFIRAGVASAHLLGAGPASAASWERRRFAFCASRTSSSRSSRLPAITLSGRQRQITSYWQRKVAAISTWTILRIIASHLLVRGSRDQVRDG